MSTTRCPVCGKRVPVRDHPSPAWRALKPHNNQDGEPCRAAGRSRSEAAEMKRQWDMVTDDV